MKTTRALSVLLMMILLVGILGEAQETTDGTEPPEPPREISALFRTILEECEVPGLAGALIVGDRVEALGVLGVRERGADAEITLQDRFHVGSLTKSMTATVAAALFEKGKISWETTVGEVFGGHLPDVDEAWHPVTLAQLLNHRGGAPAELESYGLSLLHFHTLTGPPRDHRMTLATRVLTRPPAYPPGSKYLYSNTGYALAGAMLEEVTDTSWRELIAAELFEPLKLTSAGFGPPCAKDTLDQPRGHHANGLPAPGIDNPPAFGPAGRVHCTISDLARYAAFHLAGARGEDSLLKPESFARLHTPPEGAEPGYAMGWLIEERPWAKGRVLTHSGSNTLWYAVIWIAPEANFAVIAACNQGGDAGRRATDEVCSILIREHVDER